MFAAAICFRGWIEWVRRRCTAVKGSQVFLSCCCYNAIKLSTLKGKVSLLTKNSSMEIVLGRRSWFATACSLDCGGEGYRWICLLCSCVQWMRRKSKHDLLDSFFSSGFHIFHQISWDHECFSSTLPYSSFCVCKPGWSLKEFLQLDFFRLWSAGCIQASFAWFHTHEWMFGVQNIVITIPLCFKCLNTWRCRWEDAQRWTM